MDFSFYRTWFYRQWFLLKISDGQNISYLDKEDLTNTYNVNNVFNKIKGDMDNWGYDKNKIIYTLGC